MVNEGPSASIVNTLALEISESTLTTCSENDKAALKNEESSLDDAVNTLDQALDSAQSDLEAATGTTISSSELTATAAAVTTTTTAGFVFRPPETRLVVPGIYAFTLNFLSHSMFIITDESVSIIDPMNTDHSKAMLAAIRNLTTLPIKYLFYTHNHWDHVSGGKVFKDEGAVIISHVEANNFFVANPNPQVFLNILNINFICLSKVTIPDQTWTGNMTTYNLGNFTLELYYLGINHGHGLTTFVIPEVKVGFIADLGSPGSVLFAYLPDANIDGLQASLEKYEKFDVETIVFAHSGRSDSLAPGKMDDVRALIKYIKVATQC